MTEQRPPSRFWLVGLVLVTALISALAVAWLMSAQADGQPLTTAAALAATPAAQAQTQPSEMELAMELARGMSCRQAALALIGPADATRKTWTEHRNAHRRGPHGSGEISQEQMVAVWKATLAAYDAEDPAYGAARDAMVAACKEG